MSDTQVLSASILDFVADGVRKRYTRATAAELRETITAWRETAEARSEQIELMNIDAITEAASAAAIFAANDEVFKDLHEMLEKIVLRLKDLNVIYDKLGELMEMASEFEEHSEVWIEKIGDSEDVAAGRDQMESAADALRAIRDELLELGLDIEIEAGD